MIWFWVTWFIFDVFCVVVMFLLAWRYEVSKRQAEWWRESKPKNEPPAL